MRARSRPYNGRQVIMGVRPEHLALGDGAPGSSFDARVEVVEQLGSEILLETRVGGHSVTVARVARGDARSRAAIRSASRRSPAGCISSIRRPSCRLPVE